MRDPARTIRLLSGSGPATHGVVCDGYLLQRLAWSLLPLGERGPHVIHVWLTERLFASWAQERAAMRRGCCP